VNLVRLHSCARDLDRHHSHQGDLSTLSHHPILRTTTISLPTLLPSSIPHIFVQWHRMLVMLVISFSSVHISLFASHIKLFD